MSDLLSILPAFPLTAFTYNILSSLETHSISISDLLTLDNLDVSRRTGISLLDVRRFTNEVVEALHGDLESGYENGQMGAQNTSDEMGESGFNVWQEQRYLSSGDVVIDQFLGGGLMLGCITEFVGESGVGKTQILLQLCVAAQLPESLGGLGRSAVYISTESSLPTTRLVQMLASFRNKFAESLDLPDSLSTDNVLSITCGDLESQEHILNYQLPVVVQKHNIGLVVLDSVAANFRAGYSNSRPDDAIGRAATLAKRGKELIQLGHNLRNLARVHNLAVVVANQVSDRFESEIAETPNSTDVMSLDYQSRWFTGWGDDGEQAFDTSGGKKTPALGLVWTNCIAARVALLKAYGTGAFSSGGNSDASWRRRMKIVYAPWVESGRYLDYVITGGGIEGLVQD